VSLLLLLALDATEPQATVLPVWSSVGYELVAVARTPAASGAPELVEIGPIVAPSITWTDELEGPGAIQFSCEVDRLSSDVKERFRDLKAHPTEVWLNLDGQRVAAGPVFGYQLQGGTLSATAPGLLAYLGYMWLTEDLVFAGVDQFAIAAALIDHWQDLAYGHFGIDTSGVGTSGVPPRDRSYVAAEQHQVLRRVLELAAVDDGFDVHIDPATRELVLHHPYRGEDLTSSVVVDARNITDDSLVVSVAPGDLASEAFGLGTGPTAVRIVSTRSDATVRAAFGRAGVAENFDGVSVQGTLDDHTQALLDARTDQLITPAAGLIPVDDVNEMSFGPGDTIAYAFDPGLGLVALERRVLRKQVTVDAKGSTEVSVAFA
jgi:hypothetical protein